MSSSQAQQQARRSAQQFDMQLLEHEQLHFDIAEVAVRKIRASFGDFRNACAEAGGTGPIQQMVAQADRDLQAEQARYDRETGHGVNARVQEQWARRIRTLLN
jgi:predicted secreted Zn-dependent protease